MKTNILIKILIYGLAIYQHIQTHAKITHEANIINDKQVFTVNNKECVFCSKNKKEVLML